MEFLKLVKGHEKLFEELNHYILMYKLFNIIRVSLKLNIFDSLKSPKSLNELSNEFNITLNKLEPLLNILTSLKYIEVNNGKYSNVSLSNKFLTSDSISSMKDYFFTESRFSNQWYNLEETLLNDNIVFKDEDMFINVVNGMGFECLLGELDKTMNIIKQYPEFMKAKTSIDIGGGHGLYAIAMEKINPNLESYIFDLEPVLKNSEEFIKKFNSNVKTIAGDFNKEDFGGKYDIIFSSYNPGGKNPVIAKKIYNSLNNESLFITKQCFNDENSEKIKQLDDFVGELEWNMSHLNNNSFKNNNKYSFKGDLNFNEYIAYLEKLGFIIMDIYSEKEFANDNYKNCNAKMIIAKK